MFAIGRTFHPVTRFGLTVDNYEELLESEPEIFEYCYEYWIDEMPYGTAKARDGDPMEWVFEHLAHLLGE